MHAHASATVAQHIWHSHVAVSAGCQASMHRACAGKFASAQKLMELVQHTESDAWLALSLASHLSLLPLTRQLSCLSGSLWSRTLQARASTAACCDHVPSHALQSLACCQTLQCTDATLLLHQCAVRVHRSALPR